MAVQFCEICGHIKVHHQTSWLLPSIREEIELLEVTIPEFSMSQVDAIDHDCDAIGHHSNPSVGTTVGWTNLATF